MSTGEEQDDSNNNDKKEDNDNNNNINDNNNNTATITIDYTKLDKNELLKNNPFVKDLWFKLDVLKKGIVDERKKTAILVSKVKKLEEELDTKKNENKKLNEEIKIFKEQNNTENNNTNNNTNNTNNINDKQSELALISAKEEIKKLNEQIINLKLEQESTNNKMKKTLDETEDLKKEYQTQIRLLSEANDSIIKEYKTLKSEKSNLDKEFINMKIESKKQSNIPPPELVREKEQLIREKNKLLIEKDRLISEKEHFEALIKDYKKSKDEAMIQLEACLKKNGELVLENQTYKDSIYNHEINSGKMAQKLAEYKNIIISMNLRNQVFHVKKLGIISHNEIDIIFGKGQNGNYVMRIDEKNNSEMINILDVESFFQNDKKKNKVDISYMYKSKKYNISVLVNELIVDQFIEAYKNFYSESMKLQNKINI